MEGFICYKCISDSSNSYLELGTEVKKLSSIGISVMFCGCYTTGNYRFYTSLINKMLLVERSLSMLEYIRSNKYEFVDDVRLKYPKCKVLMINMDISDMTSLKGMVYAVSRSKDTFNLLCKERGILSKQGIITMILGSYGGGAIGVQYEIKK